MYTVQQNIFKKHMDYESTLMALIYCPECNKEISEKALVCPHCGLPLEKNKSGAPIDIPHVPNRKVCPSSNSENAQTISGSSTGFRVSNGLEGGVGKISSRVQTSLAEQLMPIKEPSEIFGMLIGCGISAFVANAIFDSEMGTLVSLIGWLCMILWRIFF